MKEMAEVETVKDLNEQIDEALPQKKEPAGQQPRDNEHSNELADDEKKSEQQEPNAAPDYRAIEGCKARPPPLALAVETVRVRGLPDGRLSRADAARYLGVTPKTLSMWQLEGKGPPSVKVGGRVFYYRSALDAFIAG
jgi:hypothetical protein